MEDPIADNPEVFYLSGVLPMMCVDSDNNVTQVTICASISGGKNEYGGMPKEITIARWNMGVLKTAHYFLVGYTDLGKHPIKHSEECVCYLCRGNRRHFDR